MAARHVEAVPKAALWGSETHPALGRLGVWGTLIDPDLRGEVAWLLGLGPEGIGSTVHALCAPLRLAAPLDVIELRVGGRSVEAEVPLLRHELRVLRRQVNRLHLEPADH